MGNLLRNSGLSIFVLLGLSLGMGGCFCPSYPQSETTPCPDCPNLTENLTALEVNLSATLAERAIMVERINNLSVENSVLWSELKKLENCSRPIFNCTPAKKYSFTCADVMSDYQFLTKYPCYWETRTKYGFGKYYTPAVCQIPDYSLPDVCACYWTIPEFIGTRISAGYGVSEWK